LSDILFPLASCFYSQYIRPKTSNQKRLLNVKPLPFSIKFKEL
jgi:hypothetical protein